MYNVQVSAQTWGGMSVISHWYLQECQCLHVETKMENTKMNVVQKCTHPKVILGVYDFFSFRETVWFSHAV